MRYTVYTAPTLKAFRSKVRATPGGELVALQDWLLNWRDSGYELCPRLVAWLNRRLQVVEGEFSKRANERVHPSLADNSAYERDMMKRGIL